MYEESNMWILFILFEFDTNGEKKTNFLYVITWYFQSLQKASKTTSLVARYSRANLSVSLWPRTFLLGNLAYIT